MRNLLTFLMIGLLFAAGSARAQDGITMRIRQEMNLGDLNSRTDYNAMFLGNKFRVEGKMTLVTMEMDVSMTVVSDGATVRQIARSPFGPQAITVNLVRVHEAIPEYDPSKTYDPQAYQKLLKDSEDKKPLEPLELDGVATDGWALELPQGRLSTPSNISLGMPDPARIRIWVGRKDGIARRVDLEDTQGVTFLKMTYSNIKTGVSLDPKLFTLEWPEGVNPMDVTEMILNGVAATRQPPKQQ